MSAKNTINEALFYVFCQILMIWRRYVSRPKIVSIAGVDIVIDKKIISHSMVTSLYRGYYERAEQHILNQTLSRDDKILELGGGIGFISSFASKKINMSESSITVVEANPELIPYIRKNHKQNSVTAIVHNCVLSNRNGETFFYLADNFWASSLDKLPERTEVSVPMKRFDEMIIASKSNYVIIDIEGGEYQLFVEDKIILPEIVNKLCIELHPSIIGDKAISNVIQTLLNQGFVMNLSLVKNDTVIFFNRQDKL